MSEIVTVAHPVPTTWMPRRARLKRLALVRWETPVELPRIEPGEVGPRIAVQHGRSEIGFHAIGGRAFLRVDEPGRGRDTARLLRDLAAGRGGQRETLLDLALAGTPVSAQLLGTDVEGRDADLRGADVRGVPLESLGPCTVHSADAEAFRALLRDWVRDNVRVAGDGLYVDTGGPVLRMAGAERYAEFRLEAFPRRAVNRTGWPMLPFTPEEAAGYRSRWIRIHHGGREDAWGDLVADELPRGLPVGHGTIQAFANAAPGFVVDAVAPGLRRAGGGSVQELDGIPLRRAALLGSIGAIRGDAVEDVLGRVARVALSALVTPGLGNRDVDGVRRIRDHIQDWVVPRMREARDGLVAEDADALGGLAQ